MLEGIVRGADSKPLEGAFEIARTSLAGFAEPPLTTSTDAKGAFRFALKDLGPYTVCAEAAGWAGATLEKVRPGSPLTITLAKGAPGVVRDGLNGEPAPGARVEARDNTAISLPWEPEAGALLALSDEQGRYRIDSVGAGLPSLTASARGYARRAPVDARPGSSGVDL